MGGNAGTRAKTTFRNHYCSGLSRTSALTAFSEAEPSPEQELLPPGNANCEPACVRRSLVCQGGIHVRTLRFGNLLRGNSASRFKLRHGRTHGQGRHQLSLRLGRSGGREVLISSSMKESPGIARGFLVSVQQRRGPARVRWRRSIGNNDSPSGQGKRGSSDPGRLAGAATSTEPVVGTIHRKASGVL